MDARTLARESQLEVLERARRKARLNPDDHAALGIAGRVLAEAGERLEAARSVAVLCEADLDDADRSGFAELLCALGLWDWAEQVESQLGVGPWTDWTRWRCLRHRWSSPDWKRYLEAAEDALAAACRRSGPGAARGLGLYAGAWSVLRARDPARAERLLEECDTVLDENTRTRLAARIEPPPTPGRPPGPPPGPPQGASALDRAQAALDALAYEARWRTWSLGVAGTQATT